MSGATLLLLGAGIGSLVTLIARDAVEAMTREWRARRVLRRRGVRLVDAQATHAAFSEDFGQEDTRVICGD
jgi:hypothetical protein